MPGEPVCGRKYWNGFRSRPVMLASRKCQTVRYASVVGWCSSQQIVQLSLSTMKAPWVSLLAIYTRITCTPDFHMDLSHTRHSSYTDLIPILFHVNSDSFALKLILCWSSLKAIVLWNRKANTKPLVSRRSMLTDAFALKLCCRNYIAGGRCIYGHRRNSRPST